MSKSRNLSTKLHLGSSGDIIRLLWNISPICFQQEHSPSGPIPQRLRALTSPKPQHSMYPQRLMFMSLMSMPDSLPTSTRKPHPASLWPGVFQDNQQPQEVCMWVQAGHWPRAQQISMQESWSLFFYVSICVCMHSLGCTKSLLQHAGSLIFLASCKIFSSGIWTLSGGT